MRDYKKLDIWLKSHSLVLEIYKISNEFPRKETFGLISQIRRAAVSIPANIAEGAGRNTNTDFARFLNYSFGSLCEVEYYIILGNELNYISKEEFQVLSDNIESLKKMIATFMKIIAKS